MVFVRKLFTYSMAKKSIMICGLGSHAQASWVPKIKRHPDFELTGIIDTNLNLLEKLSFNIGIKEDQVYANLDELHMGDKPDIMVIATRFIHTMLFC